MAWPSLASATSSAGLVNNYNAYVLGHHAIADDKLGRAADYFAGALQSAPDNPELLRRTFDLAVAAGDEKLAVKIAQHLSKQDRFDSGATMVLVADAIKRRKWKTAGVLTERLKDAGFGSFIVPILDAWILEARGKTSRGLALLDPQTLDGFAQSYVQEHRAHLLMHERRYAEAALLYDQLLAGDEGRNVRIRIATAAAMQEDHRVAEAQERLDAASPHPGLPAAKAALAKGENIGGFPQNAREGIALLALRVAADLTRERPVPIALTMARIATFLAPQDASGWLLTAELLAQGQRFDSALAATRMVSESDVAAPVARGHAAAILSRLERNDEALKLLETAAGMPDATGEDHARYGDALQMAERFDDAANAYRRAIALDDGQGTSTWRLHYLLGSALEQGGKWPEAEVQLRKALSLAPKEASLLNYLGYALLDRGQSPKEARKLIETAHKLQPEDGYITDSLGWAQFRAGEHAAAVRTLEKAIASVPDDATISEHLGDAYWMIGRRLEARYRWKAALEAEPKPEQEARLKLKQDYGLDVALAEEQRESASRP